MNLSGDKDNKEEEWELEDLESKEAAEFSGLAARMNLLSLDCPDFQFPAKQLSRQLQSHKKKTEKVRKRW